MGDQAMTTKELIKAEIDSLNQEELDELYTLIKKFARSRAAGTKQSIMSKLREIQFDGPEDFAPNLDLYLSGEKREEPDIR